MAKHKRYRLQLKELHRVSGVDLPAQSTANVRLIKREGDKVKFSLDCKVAKVADDLGIVFGYAYTATKNGEPYHDFQGDHVIADDSMISLALDFVKSGANADAMHDRIDRGGNVPFVMPLTPEIAKAFGLEGGEVGLMIGMKPDLETFEKFKTGELTAFSIDGIGIREELDDDETIKGVFMTTSVDGHAHLIEDTNFDGGSLEGGTTSWSTSEGEEFGHDHPWIKNMDGTISIGESEGHGHGIEITKWNSAGTADNKITITTEPKGEDESMSKELETQVAKLTADLEASTAKLSTSLAFGSLSDAEKAYYSGLAEDERAAWVAKSADERAKDVKAEVAKASEANKVVYKSLDGDLFYESDDPRLVKATKRADNAEKLALGEVHKREQVELEKRAGNELGNLSGDVAARAAILKAVDGIEDEDVKKAALATLKGANDTCKRMYDTRGTHERTPVDGDPMVKYDALVAKYMTDHDVEQGVAYVAIGKTPEGAKLYNEHRASQN